MIYSEFLNNLNENVQIIISCVSVACIFFTLMCGAAFYTLIDHILQNRRDKKKLERLKIDPSFTTFMEAFKSHDT